MSTRLTLRLDFDTGARLGPGKIALLEAIARTGSIAAAGRVFGMSYRRAWLLTDEVNRTFDVPLVEARGGGRNGGGAVLTERGAEIISLYRAIEAAAQKGAEREIHRLADVLSGEPAQMQDASPGLSMSASSVVADESVSRVAASGRRRHVSEPAAPVPASRTRRVDSSSQVAKPLA